MNEAIIGKIFDAVIHGVDWICFLIVILGGLLAKYRLKAWKLDMAFKTLIVSTIAISLYVLILVMSGEFVKSDAPKFFFGYLAAAALYPVVVKPIEKLIVNALKDNGQS